LSDFILTGSACAGRDFIVHTQKIQKYSHAVIYQRFSIVIMPAVVVAEDIKLASKDLCVENYSIDSGVALRVSAANVDLSLSTDIDWVNNPHQEIIAVSMVKCFKL
jgi:hypothetical protein